MLGAAVYRADRALFDAAVDKWRKRVPAYFYIQSDGPTPVPPPRSADGTGLNKSLAEYWHGQTQMADGLSQETCRDLGHTAYGVASTFSAAETALLQGVDLYGEQSKRLAAALEFHADYLLGKAVPSWLCKGSLDRRLMPTWEIGYNHLANRLGMPLPLTRRLIEAKVRPAGADHHMVWESLTHAETGKAGLSLAVRGTPASKRAHPRIRFTGAESFVITVPGAPARKVDGSAARRLAAEQAFSF
jgi:hypothetical protein